MKHAASVLVLSITLTLGGCGQFKVPLQSEDAQTEPTKVLVESIPTTLPTLTALPRLPEDWVLDPKCPQPCWRGLRPGYSTEGDVDQYIVAHLSEQESRFLTRLEKNSCKRIYWSTEIGHRRRDINIDHDIITYSRIEATSGVYLRELIDQLGPPDYVYSVMLMPGEPSATYGPQYKLQILYPARGLIFSLMPNSPGRIKPDLVVSATEYFQPGDLRHAIRSRALCPQLLADLAIAAVEEDIEYVQSWPGYGDVTVFRKTPGALPIQLRTPAARPETVAP